MSLSPARLENSRDPDVAQELGRHKDLRTTQGIRALDGRVSGPPRPASIGSNAKPHDTAPRARSVAIVAASSVGWMGSDKYV